MTSTPYIRRQQIGRQLLLAPLLGALALALSACGSSDPKAEDIVQKGCADNADCEGGRCIDGLPGGLCTSNCTSQGDCPDGTVCTDTESVNGVCLLECSATSECREKVGTGYVCDTETNLTSGEDVRVCIDG